MVKEPHKKCVHYPPVRLGLLQHAKYSGPTSKIQSCLKCFWRDLENRSQAFASNRHKLIAMPELLNPLPAVDVMALSSVSVVSNSLRLRRLSRSPAPAVSLRRFTTALENFSHVRKPGGRVNGVSSRIIMRLPGAALSRPSC